MNKNWIIIYFFKKNCSVIILYYFVFVLFYTCYFLSIFFSNPLWIQHHDSVWWVLLSWCLTAYSSFPKIEYRGWNFTINSLKPIQSYYMYIITNTNVYCTAWITPTWFDVNSDNTWYARVLLLFWFKNAMELFMQCYL